MTIYSFDQLCAVFPTTDPNLVRRFCNYHRANQHVFEEFHRRAIEMRATGREKYSGWVIINRIRWDYDLRTTGDVFKVNNDFIALFARLLIHEQPSFQGFFELRRMKATNRVMSGEEQERRAAAPLARPPPVVPPPDDDDDDLSNFVANLVFR